MTFIGIDAADTWNARQAGILEIFYSKSARKMGPAKHRRGRAPET
jgi:hypothetical protein